ncbi:MAG: sugar ABC transporter permease [Oceanospirillaceae bacterium]|jgi:ABC-type sugar transport system permease subunit|nr:sugar ABC transporter permease [Oceanospirillaceae bacterium]MBT5628824.1 sugar ABC transporter permease [Oceanospirillaceae bacterium]MBT6100768.1 sugar ABC transporter permease [Oceanospirillaceae bacterium]MDB9904596.1 sugar ABC transporter permease [Oceanospirillaceae bacterium]MDC1351986.1 sugar ABC transporter permease [Oceanospirillaceae bacterium]|tara:strand:+ start:102 stop:1130 length:1029 start_codon:yes stop_codon:yes gene_type:complete
MPHRTFFWFIIPSLVAMVLFIALPIVSVLIQSMHSEHEQVLITSENCSPFGCKQETIIDTKATALLKAEQPLGQFIGLENYTNRSHLAFSEVSLAWDSKKDIGDFFTKILNLPFYKALSFTLTYTFVVTPFVILLGLAIALGVNSLPKFAKGPTIFVSLLPMIVTPLIGSLILFWMIDSDGVLGAALQYIFDDPALSLKASPMLTWVMLIVYGIWHSAPFSFIVFYAGLQTVPADTLEAATIDGANRWQRIRYVVVPYMKPLVVFITLMQLMDNFRVFEPIVSFSSEASATSLSWIIYNDLTQDTQLFGSAAATSMLTIVGVAILLLPVLVRTWRDFNRKTH